MIFFKPLIRIIALLFFSSVVYAQKTEEIKWSADGKGFYKYEQNAIIFYRLPSFEKIVIADASALRPAGTSENLKIQDFTFTESRNKILLFTDTKKVWRKNTRGDYWIFDVPSKKMKQIGKGLPPSSLMFAKISPDEFSVAYVSGHNLYSENISTGYIKKLTNNGNAKIINGTFDWAYEEEFSCRDGFRWSPDSKKIAFWQLDAQNIKDFLLINNTDSLYSFVKPVEYPKAGQNPSVAKIGVINLLNGKTTWMNIPDPTKQNYIPRMEWADNSFELFIETLSRKQNEAAVYFCNVITGIAKNIYSEKSDTWIEARDRWSDNAAGVEWIEGGKRFLWVSEKDGWRHIYSISRNGDAELLLTQGNYDILSLRAVDEAGGYVYFMASPENATQSYLYRASLKGSKNPEKVSAKEEKGTHIYNIAPNALFAAHKFSDHNNQSTSEWINLPDNISIRKNEPTAAVRDKKSGSPKVEMFQITTRDGVTMDGWMVKPYNFDSTKKYPLLLRVYTEPNTALVKDAADATYNRFYAGDPAADGYIQLAVDSRGTPAPKGAAWRKAIYKKLGLVNIRDQAMAALEIRKWKFVDSNRIAVYGKSGGGSATLNLLFQYPYIFSAGIAIAPVANRLLYDNIYEERYMGLPEENMDAYKECSPVTYAKNLKGSLLLIHGTGDDNVHYQGTEVLINELVKYRKKFQMMSYPNRTHELTEGEGTQAHMADLFTDFLKKNCPAGGVNN